MQKQHLSAAIFATILNLSLLGTTAIAHVGHDSEFQGDATQVMKPVVVDATMATTLGIKTIPIAVKGDTIKVPVSSVVEANGQSLVYVQEGTTYKPILVKTGVSAGDSIELTEANLKSGQTIVTQGSTLLYSQALRGGTPVATSSPSPASTSPASTSPAPTSGTPHHHGDGVMHSHDDGISKKAIIGAGVIGVVVLGAIAFGISKMRKNG